MGSTTIISDDKCLLVSDSNEVGGQYDSKKLRQDELSHLAEDNLFRKHLGIMQSYLTINQYEIYKSILEDKYDIQSRMYDQVKDLTPSKLRPVNGQVILLQADETNKRISEIISKEHLISLSPLEYLKRHWDITSEFSVIQIYDCMLRGVTQIEPSPNGDKTKRIGNLKVGLTEDNMPIHMHNSGITTGGNLKTMRGNQNDVGYIQGKTAYDMFYNDSFSTGVDKNELDGTVDTFSVQDSGIAEQSDSTPRLMHDNLPKYERFYAFIVTKNSTDR